MAHRTHFSSVPTPSINNELSLSRRKNLLSHEISFFEFPNSRELFALNQLVEYIFQRHNLKS